MKVGERKHTGCSPQNTQGAGSSAKSSPWKPPGAREGPALPPTPRFPSCFTPPVTSSVVQPLGEPMTPWSVSFDCYLPEGAAPHPLGVWSSWPVVLPAPALGGGCWKHAFGPFSICLGSRAKACHSPTSYRVLEQSISFCPPPPELLLPLLSLLSLGAP